MMRRALIERYHPLDGVERIVVSLDVRDIEERDGGDERRYVVEASHGSDRFVGWADEHPDKKLGFVR